MNIRLVLICYLSFSLLLYGCAEPKIIERISMAILLGYDIEEEEKIRSTIALRSVNQDLQSVVSIASETDKTSKGTRIQASLDSTKKIAAGQLRVVLYGKEFAEGGLKDSLSNIKMNSEMSSGLYIAVVDGKARDLIEKEYKEVSDIGQHIYYLLDHNIQEQSTISSTLHETVRDSYSPFTDMVVPLVEQDEDDVQIKGLALFNNEKMVGKLVDNEPFFAVLIREKYEAGTVQVTISGEPLQYLSKDIPDELSIALDSLSSNRTMQLVNKDSLEFDLNIAVEGRLLEVDASIRTEDISVMNKIEKEVEKEFKKEVENIIKKTQELNSDIFGIGEVYKAHVGTKNLDGNKWNELYPTIKVNVNVSIELLRNGVFD